LIFKHFLELNLEITEIEMLINGEKNLLFWVKSGRILVIETLNFTHNFIGLEKTL